MGKLTIERIFITKSTHEGQEPHYAWEVVSHDNLIVSGILYPPTKEELLKKLLEVL